MVGRSANSGTYSWMASCCKSALVLVSVCDISNLSDVHLTLLGLLGVAQDYAVAFWRYMYIIPQCYVHCKPKVGALVMGETKGLLRKWGGDVLREMVLL